MRSRQKSSERDGFASLESSEIEVLSSQDERLLLQELAACKSRLARSLASTEGVNSPVAADDPETLANYIASAYVNDGPTGAASRRNLIASTPNCGGSLPWPI